MDIIKKKETEKLRLSKLYEKNKKVKTKDKKRKKEDNTLRRAELRKEVIWYSQNKQDA